MNRTLLSLYYLCSYLIVGGLVLLLFPKEGLRVLLSNGDYGNIMPRFAGMLMAGLGMSIFGIVRARAEALYPRTLMIRAFFLICIVVFYAMTHDPFFLVLLAVVGFGFAWTGIGYLTERK
ncbi:MAG: hypothetical protein JSR89_11470 [Proteobacteria bacterium]|nr:hypothetical protein [Pseudomonadota bacterium]